VVENRRSGSFGVALRRVVRCHDGHVKTNLGKLSLVALTGLAALAWPQPAGATLAPSERVCFEVVGSPGDAAVVNVTPVGAGAPGNGLLVSSDVGSAPAASSVNFVPGSVDPNVAVARIGADGRVCFVNSHHSAVDVVADHLGTISGSAWRPAQANGAPDRKLDTRQTGGRLAPHGRACFAVGGEPGDAAVVNLTPVLAGGAGHGQLVSSDVVDVPVASNVNFGAGSVDPNVAVARIGADGRVCFVNSGLSAVDVVADHVGTIAGDVWLPARPSGAPDRRLDTRASGGRLAPHGRACFAVGGEPGDAAVVNLTPALAGGAGHGQLVSSDVVDVPVASNVNFGAGSVDPNVAVARIGADGRVCFVNSGLSAVDVVADHLGTISGSAWRPAQTNGAPDRRLDTRPPAPANTVPLERVSLLLDYEAGYGGYIYPVYNPYAFFTNGQVVKEPKVPLDQLRLDALDKDQAGRWGTYVVNGNKVTITYTNGDRTEKDWPGAPAIPAPGGTTLQGAFSSITGGGNLAVGGSVGVLAYSRMTFTSDGWFTNENISGGSSSAHVAYSRTDTAGRYTIDGHTITLRFNSGDVGQFFFAFYGNDFDVFRIAGRTYTSAS